MGRVADIRVFHFGLGPIGSAIVRQVAAKPGLEIVGAADIDPTKTSKDLGDVVGLTRRLGVRVQRDALKALKGAKPHVVLHCTTSSLAAVMPQLEMIAAARARIVS